MTRIVLTWRCNGVSLATHEEIWPSGRDVCRLTSISVWHRSMGSSDDNANNDDDDDDDMEEPQPLQELVRRCVIQESLRSFQVFTYSNFGVIVIHYTGSTSGDSSYSDRLTRLTSFSLCSSSECRGQLYEK